MKRPIGQRAVGLGIVGTVPLAGDSLRAAFQGGPDLGNLTLTRFFTLHGFILPVALCLLAVVHVYLFRFQGVTPPWWRSPEQLKAQEEPFWPGQVFKDVLVALALLVGLGVWCLYRPAPLGAEADPSRPFEARPEWYFMFLFRMLNYFEGPYEVVGTFVLPAAFFTALFFWPFLDRNPQRDPRRRPLAIALLALATAGLLGSTIYAIATDVRLPEPAMAAKLEPGVPPPAGPIQKLQIARVYHDHCAACHSDDGSGSPLRPAMPSLPDFRNMAWQMTKTDLEIVHQIQVGKEPRMPAFGGKLSPEQILGLAIFLRAFAVAPAAESHPAPVAEHPPTVAKEVPRPIAPKETPPPSRQPPILRLTGATLPRHLHGLSRRRRPRHARAGRHAGDSRLHQPQVATFSNGCGVAALDPGGERQVHVADEGQSGRRCRQRPGRLREELHRRKTSGSRQQPPQIAAQPASPKVSETTARTESPPSRPTAKPELAAVPGPAIIAPPSPSETAERVRSAAASYRQNCLTCHGADGRGTAMRTAMPSIPDFTNSAWQRNHSSAQLTASVQTGKGVFMPAFGQRLKPNEIRDLLAYVRAFGPPAPAGPGGSNRLPTAVSRVAAAME